MLALHRRKQQQVVDPWAARADKAKTPEEDLAAVQGPDLLEVHKKANMTVSARRKLNEKLKKEKQAIGTERTGHSYSYYPVAKEADCVKQETESFLDRVEQNMFGTLRRVFNLLMMYDETQPIQPLLDQLADAQAHNDRALDQASRLCAAMTDYVNNQGATADVYGSVEQFIQILQEELV